MISDSLDKDIGINTQQLKMNSLTKRQMSNYINAQLSKLIELNAQRAFDVHNVHISYVVLKFTKHIIIFSNLTKRFPLLYLNQHVCLFLDEIVHKLHYAVQFKVGTRVDDTFRP